MTAQAGFEHGESVVWWPDLHLQLRTTLLDDFFLLFERGL